MSMTDHVPPPHPGFEHYEGAGGEPGGFWIRVVAYILDAIIVGIAASIIVIPLTMVMGQSLVSANAGAYGATPDFSAMAPIWAVQLIIYVAYYCYIPSTKWQATPGKKALGLYIIKSDGSRPGFGTMVLRYIGYIISSIILAIGFIMVAFTENKRGLHDMIAGTRVIKGRPG